MATSGIDGSTSQSYQNSYQATREANEQITRANQAVKEAQKQADASLEHVRDSFDQERSIESTRNEDSLAKQQMKGYEELREMKRMQDAELHRVRREGEDALKKSTEYYRDSVYQNTQKSEEDLRQLQAREAREANFVKTSGMTEVDLAKSEQARKIEDLKRSQEEQFQAISEASKAQYEQMKTNTLTSSERETAEFQKNYQATVEGDQKSIAMLNHTANQQIKQIRQDTAQKLAAYSSRQSDPFYKMMDMNAKLQDTGDGFMLTATIPTHEQDHFSVQVHGNELVISGTRRNEEKLDLGPGRSRGTSSYQSFTESFPLPQAVDKGQLTKEFDGDTVTIRVPKAAVNSYEPHKSTYKPERLRAERPQFPGNLPVSPEEAKKGGQTLT
jgi:HSP20 family molecular chaperone IbpA